MRQNGNELGIAFWFLVAAFAALMIGRAHAEEAAPMAPAPAVMASMSQPSPSTPEGASAIDAAARAFRGQVILSDVMIAPASAFPSGEAMVGALHRLKRSTVQGADGFWRLHMVAFPSSSAAGGTYRLRATDTTDRKPRKPIRVFEISAQPGRAEVEMPDLVLTDVMGFKAGHTYEIAVVGGREADGAAGKEDVYAQGVITLM